MPDPLISPPAVGLAGVWILGLSMGLTACTATCLPYMGTWVLGRGEGVSGALRDGASFLLGRVSAYGVLGALAGAAGAWLTSAISGSAGNLAIGAASVAAGAWLFASARSGGPCGIAKSDAPPFILGVSLTLVPCAPLASLLAACALSGGAVAGAGYGLAFGLGAAVTPLLIILPLVGLFGRRLREGRPWLERWTRWGSAAVLVAIGLRRAVLAW